MLAQKRMFFNCTGPKDHAAGCKSKMRCQKCGQKHDTSICTQGDREKWVRYLSCCESEREYFAVHFSILELGVRMHQLHYYINFPSALAPKKFVE